MAFSVFCRLLEYNLSRRISIYEQMHFMSVVSSYCKDIFEYIVNILYNLSTQISIYEQMHFESVQCTYCMLFAPKVGLVDRLVHFTMQSFACNTLKNFAKQLSSYAVLFGSLLDLRCFSLGWYVMTQPVYSEPYIYGLLHLRKGTILASKI